MSSFLALGSAKRLWGEPAVYLKKGGEERSITVVVDRVPPRREPLTGERLEHQLVITADNDSTTGIAAGEITMGADRVRVSVDYEGGPTKDLLIGKPDDGKPWADVDAVRLQLK